jgi:hypothetical protein
MDVTKDRHGKRKASHHDEEGKRKKKHHKGEQDSKSSSRKKDRHKAIKVVDDDAEDDEMWVEHNIDVDGQHVSGPSAYESCKALTHLQPVTTAIPTGASLDIRSTANVMDDDPALPRATTTESKQQREEWMLLQPSAPVVPLPTPPLHSLDHGDTLTDGYGERTTGNRTMSGEVDFFSSLGTEHRKKDVTDKRNPETVCST